MERLEFARRLRVEQTDAEQRLWQHLRAKRLLGMKFRRQKPIGPYIVEFICQERMLVIEVDGGKHPESKSNEARDTWFVVRGFRVLRFWNHEVLQETEAVLEAIRLAAEEAFPGNPLSPGPSPLQGEGPGERADQANNATPTNTPTSTNSTIAPAVSPVVPPRRCMNRPRSQPNSASAATRAIQAGQPSSRISAP